MEEKITEKVLSVDAGKAAKAVSFCSKLDQAAQRHLSPRLIQYVSSCSRSANSYQPYFLLGGLIYRKQLQVSLTGRGPE